MGEGLSGPEDKKPLEQAWLEELYREKVGSKLPNAKEFKAGVATVIMLALETKVINYSDILELLNAMRRCLDNETLGETPFGNLVAQEYTNLWNLLTEEQEKKRRQTPPLGTPVIKE